MEEKRIVKVNTKHRAIEAILLTVLGVPRLRILLETIRIRRIMPQRSAARQMVASAVVKLFSAVIETAHSNIVIIIRQCTSL